MGREREKEREGNSDLLSNPSHFPRAERVGSAE